jgi:twitching motility protein PilT
MSKIDELFQKMFEQGASDLHIVVGLPPMTRLHGDLYPLEGLPVLPPETTRDLLFEIMNDKQRESFMQNLDFDMAYDYTGICRFRCNILNTRKGVQAVFRIIPTKIKTLTDLKMPEALRGLSEIRQGLVLVTGPTGSGKSTTLAAMVDHINSTREAHVITIEDPIEFVHENRKAVITQREVGTHVTSFADAIKAAGREDPDVILVGEMRDLETISLAISTSTFGVVVYGTLHTNSAASTVDRIIDSYPHEEQTQVRTMLADSLKGIVAQQLLKTADGHGRCAANEVLLGSPALSNLIREGKTFQIPSLIQTGTREGMQSMDSCLFRFFKEGRITAEAALEKAQDKLQFIRQIEKEGVKLEF